MKKGSIGESVQKAWQTDEPLRQNEGGSLEVATAEGLTSHADTLRKGGAWLALGCLSWLSPDFSLSGIKYHDNRIEGLGRHLWCTQNGASAGKMPPAAQLQGYAPDTFWKDNRVQMPASWPEMCILPIGLRDLSALPAKGEFKLAAMDEVVASFYKMCCALHSQIAEVEKDLARISSLEKEGKHTEQDIEINKGLEERLAPLKQQWALARTLQRNVVFSFRFAETEDDLFNLSVSLREELPTLSEYCGLTGWDRIMLIGMKRDELRRAGKPHGAADVTAALSVAGIKWGPGRKMTEELVAKSLAIWDKVRLTSKLVDIIQLAKAHLGTDSPFEDWTRLSMVSNKCTNVDDFAWVLDTMLQERFLKYSHTIFLLHGTRCSFPILHTITLRLPANIRRSLPFPIV